MTPADWWATGGLNHAFPRDRFPFRSLCGEVRWSTAVHRAFEEPRCPVCEEHERAGTTGHAVVDVTGTAPMDADLKKRVYAHRRRWNGTTHR